MIQSEVISMKCPNCGYVFDDGCRYCGVCGAALEPEKKGSHLVPILILIGLTILGIGIFFATGGSFSAPSAQTTTFSDTNYILEDGVLQARHHFPGVSTITVPGTLGGQTVTALDRYGFAECDDLIVIHLPDSVTTIGEFAFAGCDSLRSMDLPASVKEIEGDAFRDCPSLEAVHIPASVREIGPFVFSGCDSLAFIFYDGTIDQWKALYTGELNPKTAVCCSDGEFFQSQ